MNFIPVTAVRIDDPLWTRQFELVRDVMLPYMWEILNDGVEGAEKSHCIENFKIAAGQSNDAFYGAVFVDTDLYKWIEAVAYCLAVEKNEVLESYCDQAIDLLGAAQQPDGYLVTYYILNAPEYRWTNLMEGHELYCAGHMIEGAVAYYEATGKDKFLKIAQRFADLIDRTFGETKTKGYPGHPEIELALIRLYNATNEVRYLKLAKYFVDERGVGENIFELERKRDGHRYIFPEMAEFKADYFQAHLPVRDQQKAAGHAVRAMYLYCAMADLARLTNDNSLAEASETVYKNVIRRQMYVTGGIGSAKLGERFTSDFDLPSDAAYAETCASIGLILFSSRMWLLNKNKVCYDIWEQALYNAVLSGMGSDGGHFFYVNPLEVVPQTIKNNPMLSHVKTQRQKWFGVACCPPNLARILSSMRGYIYALDKDTLFVLSHIGSSFQKDDLNVTLSRKKDDYTFVIEGEPIDVLFRLPENTELLISLPEDADRVSEGWEVNGNGYFKIRHKGGKCEYRYTLKPMIRLLRANPRVSGLAGKSCLQRGMTVYCLEGVDNAVPLSALRLPADAAFTEQQVGWLGEDMPMLKTTGYRVSETDWENSLYNSTPEKYEPIELTFIPYSQWGNRGENEMRVWINEK